MLLVLSLLFTVFSVTAAAADQASFTVSVQETAMVGDTITVTVDMSTIADGRSFNFRLNYDTAKLEYVSHSSSYVANHGSGTVSVAAATMVPETLGGTVLTATFKAVAAGTANFSLSDCKAAAGEVSAAISTTTSDDSVEIGAPHVCAAANGWKSNETHHWKVCADCGQKMSETEAAHTYGEAVKSMKTEGGVVYEVYTETCSVCGYEKETTKKHDTSKPADKDWTVKDDGSQHGFFCDDCDAYHWFDHSWDDGVVVEEATEDKAGLKKYTCKVCGYEKTVPYELDQKDEFPWWILLGAAGGEPFSDVTSADWFYNDVVYVYNKGLMNGVSDTTFAPNATTTRAMIVTILWRLDGKAAGGATTFTDVAADSWYADAVAWAAKYGIVTGYDAATFGPNDPITREQLATILYRFNNYRGGSLMASELDFVDAGSVSGYAVDAMKWAVGQGLVNGMDGKLNPAGFATRAQVAAILHRYCE